MDKQTSTGAAGGLLLEVGLEYHKTIDYDRSKMRRALRSGAAVVTKESRRLVSRRAISAPGEYPGMQSGRLRRGIGTVSRGRKGGWIKVSVRTIKGSDFYPAFLHRGSPKTGLAPRGNFVADALDNKRDQVRNNIRGELRQSLVPR